MRVEIGYKFMLGFIAVVASVAFTPYGIDYLNLDIPEWLKDPFTILVAITLGLILGTFISRGLTKDFNQLADHANHIGSGDLTREIEIDKSGFFQDETSDLAYSLDQMLQNLRELVSHIKKTSINITQTSRDIKPLFYEINETDHEVKKATESIHNGARRQNQHVQKSAKIIKCIDEISRNVAGCAEDAAELASDNNQVVREASIRANRAIDKFEKIFFGIERAREVILGLEERVSSVPKLLDFIAHISRQTDLLAINASIEASKAGEYGKGFANVAYEVRRFADNTRRSSKEVAAIVEDFRQGMEVALNAFREGSSFVHEGREEMHRIQGALEEILKGISNVNMRIKEILELSHKQREGVGATVKVAREVSQIAHENLGIAEDVERIIDHHRVCIKKVGTYFERLQEMAQELEWVVMKFRTEDLIEDETEPMV